MAGWLHALSWFEGGAFFVNTVPHFVRGTMGRAFPTPFAKPPGRGLSFPVVNVLWGVLNLIAGYLLVCRVSSFDGRATADILPLALGGTLTGLMLARSFGRLRGGDTTA